MKVQFTMGPVCNPKITSSTFRNPGVSTMTISVFKTSVCYMKTSGTHKKEEFQEVKTFLDSATELHVV